MLNRLGSLDLVIKKRIIISIIITILAIIGSHNYWLIKKPLDISFNAKGQNIEQIEVQLYKYNSVNSKKFYYQNYNSDISNKKHLKFAFKKPLTPKRLKILVKSTSKSAGGGLVLDSINFKNNKLKLNDLNNFSVDNANIKVENNQLIISNIKDQCTISYNNKLNVRASIKFDLLILLIITIFSYLFTYKLTSYLADFKISQNKSRIDIIFLAAFFVILFIPMMRISNEKKSSTENRMLATYKPLFKPNKQLNFNYGKDFDKWFSDRFNFRENLIFAKSQLNYKVRTNYIESTNTYMYKQNGWLFGENFAFSPLQLNEIKKISDNFDKFDKYCENHNIKLYIIILPSKESYYKEKNYRYTNTAEDCTLKLLNYTNQYTKNLKILYPYKELKKEEKNNDIYYKIDTHLTDYGIYILYKHIINKLKKDFPLLEITPMTDYNIYNHKLVRFNSDRKFNNGTIYPIMKIKDNKLLNPQSLFFDYKYPEKIKITGNKIHFTHINSNNNYKLLIIGDSFQESLSYFLNTSFKQIEKYRTNLGLDIPRRKYMWDIKSYYPIIDEYKPDAIILIRHSGRIKEFLDMYPEEEN